MTIRIPGSPSTPQNPQIINDPGVCPVAPQTSATATAPATTSKPAPYLDAYGPDDTSKDASFSESQQLSTSTPESKAQEFSVKDACFANVSAPASTATANPAKDAVKLEDTPLVKDILNSIGDKNITPVNFYSTSPNKLLGALENEDALRSLLANAPGGSSKLADKTIDKMKDAILHSIGTSMYKQVRSAAHDSQKFIQPLMESESSRKAYLTTIVSESKGDPQFIQTNLQAIGYPQKDAIKLANTLAPMHEKTIDSKVLDAAQDQLCKIAQNIHKDLGNLSGGMVSNTKNNNRFLTDPTFEDLKTNTIKNISVKCESPKQVEALEKLLTEATFASKKADFIENVQITVVMTAVTLATAGLAAGVGGGIALGAGMGLMGSAPEIIQAIATPDKMQASASLKLTSQQNAQDATTDRNITIGKNIAFAMMGAAASKVAGATKPLAAPAAEGTLTAVKKNADKIVEVGIRAFELGREYIKID